MLERLGRRVSEGPSGTAGDHAGEDGGAAVARTGPILSLRQAAKAFGAVHALVDGSIDLYPGEAHGLVGENGAGKSTLVRSSGVSTSPTPETWSSAVSP